ncbi:MAG: FAD binding domain-containing protein [Ferruginibacter sp.]|nr:FAD binding domain-containing protein [Chitinophagaceae bacterium]MBP6285936.1 FAD binding domain-containing protein [Ferruginibacter sp.]
MIRFILNDKLIETELPSGSTVLDFVRCHKRLTGTKIGCREGDCGACTVLVGDFDLHSNGGDKLVYRSMTSCLMPLGNAQGKHIVSVEGINLPAGRQGMKELSPVQQAMVDTNGTQCGFCTIGFVMSLTGFVLDENTKQYGEAIASIDGNICRCTGYKSIERAAAILSEKMNDKPGKETIAWLVKKKFIPEYFLQIKDRLIQLRETAAQQANGHSEQGLMIGGGTDLIVQKALTVKRSSVQHLSDNSELHGIRSENGRCYIGGAVTVTAFAESKRMQDIFPGLPQYIKLISSTPIRNMATMAGNIVNASPIGDMSIFFLALDAELVLNRIGKKRTVKLRDFYKGYKETDRSADERMEQIVFTPPQKDQFSFEKVCKRTHLDIASVNSACQVKLDAGGLIETIHLSAGGVAPFPKYLTATADFLKGKMISAAVLKEAIAVMNTEIAPISDARGTADYKRLLLRQLFLAHFKIKEELIRQVVGV